MAKGCKTKLTDVKYFKCPKCALDLCLTHRFEDMHDCKPIKKTEKYEIVKNKISLFNWNDGGLSNKVGVNKSKKGGQYGGS